MPAKGLKIPKDLANRIKVSHARHGVRLANLPKATMAAYDCRTLGFVTPVKDQGQCGDCWNFSGTGAAEMSSIVAGKGTAATTNWSEQSVLDCGQNGGCDGDWPETALEQAKNSGLANTSDYPYTGGAGRCKNVPHPNIITDYGYVGSQDAVPPVQDIKNAMVAYGPIAVAVAADDAFSNYSGGVFTGSGSTQIDHAVILVGWQDDSTVPGGGYWILRNSWNTSWGESGYMRIAYGANMVGYGAMWAKAGTPLPPAPPTPPVPPAPPVVVYPTYSGPVTLTGTIPGTFGAHPVTLTGTATLTPKAATLLAAPGFTPGPILQLIIQYAEAYANAKIGAILPIIEADVAAGKSIAQIWADVKAAFLAAPNS